MKYDLILIGSGPGGYVAAIRAAQLGLKTAVVERESLGGICLNWGCIPTKALLTSAAVYRDLLHGAEYGIYATNPKADFAAIVKRSRNVAEGMSKGVQYLMKKNKIDVIYGHGRLLSSSLIEVTDAEGKSHQIEAGHIILATGARSKELPDIPIDGKKILGYRQALSLAAQPASMLVIGSGAIGCELAWFYATLGTEVTIIELLPRILPLEDEEVSRQLARSFKKIGIHMHTDASVKEIDIKGKTCKVVVQTKKAEQVLTAEAVLSSVGITANTENIGLEELAVEMDKDRVKVDAYYRSNVQGIYAIGDCIQGPALAHVASAEGVICVEKIAGLNPEPLDYGNIPSCVYCQPEVASVGYTEKQAIEAGYELKVGKFPYSASGKANAAGHKEGFAKLLFDAKYGELLGAHIVGSNATELIAEVVALRKLETTGEELIKTIHPHPTMSEAIMEAAAAAYGEAIHL